MKLYCTITEFVFDTDPKYGSFVVNYNDQGTQRTLLVRGFAEEVMKLEGGKEYKLKVKIESKWWTESKRYTTSAFLLRATKVKPFNPDVGFDREGFDIAMWKNEGK